MGLELRFVDKDIRAWGGMALMKRMLDHMRFDEALKRCALPEPGSNRGDRPEQLMLQFMLSVWCGANRFERGEVTRHAPVLQRVFGFPRMANFKAVMRLFGKFTQATNEQVMDQTYWWFFDRVQINGITLDWDSTVMTRYGHQEGAVRGYNPNKRGRCSRHPLMAFVADTRMIGNCWLRPGNASSAHNAQAFLANTLYRGCADCENRIKELKYDFAADSFNMSNFWATEAVLNTVMIAYNLMSLFKWAVLKMPEVYRSRNPLQQTLKTLGYRLFAKAAYITTESRKPILNMALAMQQRTWMQSLWEGSESFDPPVQFIPLYAT